MCSTSTVEISHSAAAKMPPASAGDMAATTPRIASSMHSRLVAMPALAHSEPCTHARRAEDREFMTMRRVFGEHGGMVTADELVHCLRTHRTQPLSLVGRWIVDRAAVQFAWRAQTWFPCFQFAGEAMSIRPAVSEIVLELRDACDDWRLALWFACRNQWLDHAPPFAVVGCDPAAAVAAARIDRSIAI